MAKLIGFVFLSAILVHPSLFANAQGGWVSGGGDLNRDAQNPWFLQNTGEVEYCIEIDELHFSATPAVVEDKVEKALTFWKEDFLKAKTNPDVPLRIATQTFVKTACREDILLRFQFGILSLNQKEVLGDYRHFVSLAVRTEYDSLRMRGKGFIFIAPDSGPMLPYEMEGRQEIWRNDKSEALYLVLVHELGHLFGLSHKPLDSVMRANFPADVIEGRTPETSSLNGYSFFEGLRRSMFMVKGDCMATISPEIAEYFKIPLGSHCLRINIEPKRFEIHASEKPDSIETLVGIGRIEKSVPSQADTDGVEVYLPKEQRAFQIKPEQYGKLHLAAFKRLPSKVGTYRDQAQTVERSFFINYLNNGDVGQFSGAIDNTLIYDLFQWYPSSKNR